MKIAELCPNLKFANFRSGQIWWLGKFLFYTIFGFGIISSFGTFWVWRISDWLCTDMLQMSLTLLPDQPPTRLPTHLTDHCPLNRMTALLPTGMPVQMPACPNACPNTHTPPPQPTDWPPAQTLPKFATIWNLMKTAKICPNPIVAIFRSWQISGSGKFFILAISGCHKFGDQANFGFRQNACLNFCPKAQPKFSLNTSQQNACLHKQ